MNNYENNIRLENKFAEQIKMILGRLFIGKDVGKDKTEATDFLVLRINPFTVACRLRTYSYYLNPKFRNQFTIRCQLASGNKTELDKIRKGFGDYMFYGFVDEQESKIIKYWILNLDVFRDYEGGMVPEVRQNKDKNPTELAAYYIPLFPPNFVIKHYENNST